MLATRASALDDSGARLRLFPRNCTMMMPTMRSWIGQQD